MAKYINADALVKRIDKELCKPCRDEKQDYNGVRCRACWVDDMLIWIDSEPTADVRENVHGKWIRSDWNGSHIRYTCSRCQLSVLSSEDYMRKHRFCFGCGAIMDEEVSDGK